MSAIGSGVALICGNQLDGIAPAGTRDAMIPVSVAVGDVITLSHFVGRKAWQILITDPNGNLLPSADFPAVQTLGVRPAPDTVAITVSSDLFSEVIIAVRWQENSTEAQLFSVGSVNAEEGPRTATIGNATLTITPSAPPTV
jgi:hypothetical protein